MDTKAKIQYALASVLLASGIILCYLAFYRTEQGTITTSVLQYFAECLIWAASIFGMTAYVDARVRGLKPPSDESHELKDES